MAWRAAVKAARQRCVALGCGDHFEERFRHYKKTHLQPEAARLAVEEVAGPRLVE